jgi:hypothetical protein
MRLELNLKTGMMEFVKMSEPYNGVDRRNNLDIQQSILKVLSKVETMETNIETKLDAHGQTTSAKLELMSGKLENLESKLTNSINTEARRIIDIETKIKDHFQQEDDVSDILEKHDRDLEVASKYVERINKLDIKYNNLAIRVKAVEDAEQVRNDKLVRDFKDFVRKGLIAVFGTALIGAFVFLMIMYLKSLQ